VGGPGVATGVQSNHRSGGWKGRGGETNKGMFKTQKKKKISICAVGGGGVENEGYYTCLKKKKKKNGEGKRKHRRSYKSTFSIEGEDTLEDYKRPNKSSGRKQEI